MMYLDAVDDNGNHLDMGSVVLAALHRWNRQEPRRRQRPCRQSLKRRQKQQQPQQQQRQRQRQDLQTGTGEAGLALVTPETATPPREPLPQRHVPAPTAADDEGTITDDAEPAATKSGHEPPQLPEMAADSRLSPVLPADDAGIVICPRPGCRTPCRGSQFCPRRSCTDPPPPPGVPAEYLVTEPDGGGGLETLRCPSCGWCVAVRVGSVWTPLESLLRDTRRRGPGWHRVTSLADRTALYLLVVYIYGERERSAARREPELRPPPAGDSALLLFEEDGAAVGFATLKRRGQLLREHAGPERFQMDILDTVFVRRSSRRRGWTGALLERLAGGAARADRRLGVTRPTPAMRRLLHAFVSGRPWARRLLFEVTWAAGVNNRTNIWDQMVADSGGNGPESGPAPPGSA